MHQKRQSSVVLRVFALILAVVFSAAAAMAQEKTATSQPAAPKTATNSANSAVKATPDSSLPARAPAETPSQAPKSNDIAVNASNDYKKSLSDLAALYERDVERLEQQNKQMKDLYRDGLISRIDLENSDKELADAHAKVETARNQIAEANKPKPILPTASENLAASNVAWSTGNMTIDNLVRFYGNKYGVDPYLIFCLMHQESRFTNSAVSPKGAQGLMQLMPGTAARYGVTNPYDVAQSISGGTRYLKDLLQMFNGRIDLALAGYNAGENAVIKYGYNIPPYEETRNYVRLITARYGKRPAPAVSVTTVNE
jgi:soluble lytic murein transglycosylase-like protein